MVGGKRAEVLVAARGPAHFQSIEPLDRVGRLLKRSRNWLINEAVEEYLARELLIITSIETGLAEAEAGKIVGDAELQKLFQRFAVDQD